MEDDVHLGDDQAAYLKLHFVVEEGLHSLEELGQQGGSLLNDFLDFRQGEELQLQDDRRVDAAQYFVGQRKPGAILANVVLKELGEEIDEKRELLEHLGR